MTVKILTDAMKRVETWPEEAQDVLAGIGLEIDAALKGAVYHPTPEELVGIDRGLRAADDGRLAAPGAVSAVFTKHCPA